MTCTGEVVDPGKLLSWDRLRPFQGSCLSYRRRVTDERIEITMFLKKSSRGGSAQASRALAPAQSCLQLR